MGRFSFLTSDTKESIPGCSFGEWVIVKPDNTTIETSFYDGQGRFELANGSGIVHILELLGREAFPNAAVDFCQFTALGIETRFGSYLVDNQGKKYGTNDMFKRYCDLMGWEGVVFFDDYSEKVTIDRIRTTINEHEKCGRLKEVQLNTDDAPKIKIVSSPKAVKPYDSLDEAKDCLSQGVFY